MSADRTHRDAYDVSTRELVDVALRSLRAHGAAFAPARQAADLIEELQVVNGQGLSTLQAALRRPIPAATVCDGVIDAHGGSTVLIGTELVDLLSTGGAATVVDAGEPYAIVGALRRVANACGGSWTAEWTRPGFRGGCRTDTGDNTYLWGELVTGDHLPPTVTIHVGPADTVHPAGATPLPSLAPALTRAREFGITVEREQWTPLVRAAERFLIDR